MANIREKAAVTCVEVPFLSRTRSIPGHSFQGTFSRSRAFLSPGHAAQQLRIPAAHSISLCISSNGQQVVYINLVEKLTPVATVGHPGSLAIGM